MGFITLLDSWDQKLLTHIHLHVVIPAGAFSEDGSQWLHPKKMKNKKQKKFLFHVKELSKAFKGKHIRLLEKAFQKGNLIFPGNLNESVIKKSFNELIQNLWEKDWVVYSKAPFGGPEQVLSYLGRYTHKVAISNHRILSIKDGEVLKICM